MKISLPALLLTLFVALRLTGHIDWSWWWVLSPLWIMACGWVLLVLFLVAVGLRDRRAGRPLGLRKLQGFHETRITNHETRLF